MAKEVGEFKERPKVKEAVPIPLKRCKPTGWIAATVVCAIVAVGAIGFMAYDKLTNGNSSKCANVANNDGLAADMKGFTIKDDFGTLYVTKLGEVFLAPTTELLTTTDPDAGDWNRYMRVSDYDEAELPGVLGEYTIKEDDIEGFRFGPGSYAEEDYTVTFKGYKLDIGNVVAVSGPFLLGHGYTGYNYAFIKNDGTIGWLNIQPGDLNNGKKASAIVTKEIEGYNDVVGVYPASSTGGFNNDVIIVKKNGSQEWMRAKALYEIVGFEYPEDE